MRGSGIAAAHGAGGSGGWRALTKPAKEQPPLLDPSRKREWRRILALFRPYRWRLAFVVGLIVCSSILSMANPFLLRETLDAGILHHHTTLLTELVGAMIGVAAITSVFSVWQTYLSTSVGQRVMHDLRAAVYRHLQRMSLAFFTRTRTGEIQSRIANDIGGLDNVVTQTATTIAQNATTVIASVVAMCLLNWRLAAISLFLLPLFVLLTRKVGNLRRRITAQQQRALADLSALVSESLSVSGILLGKTMGRGEELAERFSQESDRIADLEVRSRMAGRWLMASIQLTFAVQPAIIYWLAGERFLGGAVSVGTVVAFTTLQTRLLFPIQQLLGVGPEVTASLAIFDRIFEYLDLPVEIEEPPRPKRLNPRQVSGLVRFEGVWFRYPAAQGWTLQGIDLEIQPGWKLAVVGETGSGKTTLGYLLARLYDPQRGRITIDGVDIRELELRNLAECVGVVSQETYLLHATVKENLRFAKPEASDRELEAAAKAARIHGLIDRLPDRYDTIVGERGYRFSGGEKQRIAIARTILRNPPILILDEATSSLDTRTEAALQRELDRLARGRTTIVIAHRLSTIRDADLIVVLDRGRIAEVGTHDDLVARAGRYAALLARDVPLEAVAQ